MIFSLIKTIFTITAIIVILTLSYHYFSSNQFSDKTLNSKHFYDGNFHNENERPKEFRFFKFIKFMFLEKRRQWPNWVKNAHSPRLKTSAIQEPVITFINHATFLIEIDNLKILTDPVFSLRAGPNDYFGVKRHRAPGIAIEDLPKIDLILVTHNHYDHLDLKSLKYIQKKYNSQIVTALGDKLWLNKKGIKNVTELDWWESYDFFNNLKIHYTPAQHQTARGIFDRQKSFWGSFVIEHEKINIFHAGDTGYANHFKEIGQKFDIDLALLPIGAYDPDWFLSYVHINPTEAVQAHHDLKAKISFPMHYETFQLSNLGYLEAEKDLKQALQKNPANFKILRPGESKVMGILKN